MSHYLTFDLGTTALKTALIDSDGRMLAEHSVEYTPDTPAPDWLEMEPEVYWDAAVTGARAVVAEARAASRDLAAIGFSSQGQTFVPIDAAGNALRKAIVWVDKRAQGLVDAWESEWLRQDEFRRLTGYPWLPAELTLFKIAWLAEHDPRAYDAAKFLCLPDYLIYRLTGEAAIDHNLAQMSGLYDVQTRGWSGKMLEGVRDRDRGVLREG